MRLVPVPHPGKYGNICGQLEESRHGDILHKYLYFSDRVEMRQIEKTIQYLIGFGMVSDDIVS